MPKKLLKSLGLKGRNRNTPNRRQPEVLTDEQRKDIIDKHLTSLAPRIDDISIVFPNRQQGLTQALADARRELDNDQLEVAHAAGVQLDEEVQGLEQHASDLEAAMNDRVKRLTVSMNYVGKLAAAGGGAIPQAIQLGVREVAQRAQARRYEEATTRVKLVEKEISDYVRACTTSAVLQTEMEANVASPNEKFRDEDRKRIKKATDRGGLKGHGKFKNILDAWSDVNKHPDQPDKVASLERLVLEYLQAHPDAPDLDKVGRAKQDACHEILENVRELAAFRLRDEYAQLAQSGGGTAEQQRELHVKLLAAGKNVKVPEGKGASDSFFLADPSGRPAYIFKPMQGENEVEGFPPGGGAVREVMLSRINDSMRQTIPGLDFGVCPTTVMELDSSSFATAEGSLNSRDTKRLGAVQSAADCDGDLENFIGKGADEEANLTPQEITQRRNSIPVDDVQKIAVLDFLTLNLDRNVGNMLIKGQPDGSTRLIPIDAGNALPERQTFEDRASGMGGQPIPNDRVLGDGNALMQLDQSRQAFSPAMLQLIDQIDPATFADGARNEYDALKQAHAEFDGKIDPSTFTMMERSAMFLKRAARQMTPFEMSIAYSFFFRDILDAQPDQLNAVMDDVIQRGKAEAERTMYQTEYSQRSDPTLMGKIVRIKSVDKTAFDQLNQQVNDFCRQDDYRSACGLLDQLNAEAQRVIDEAGQNVQATIQAYLDSIRRRDMTFQQLLENADAVPPTDQDGELSKARESYRDKKAKYEQLQGNPDWDLILKAADTLSVAADALIGKAQENH